MLKPFSVPNQRFLPRFVSGYRNKTHLPLLGGPRPSGLSLPSSLPLAWPFSHPLLPSSVFQPANSATYFIVRPSQDGLFQVITATPPAVQPPAFDWGLDAPSYSSPSVGLDPVHAPKTAAAAGCWRSPSSSSTVW